MGGRRETCSRNTRRVSFGSAPPFALGVEEELFLVDAETLEAAPIFEQLVPEPSPRLKPEVFACLVETTLPICRDADAILNELQALRTEVGERATSLGAAAIATGTHPLAHGEGQ